MLQIYFARMPRKLVFRDLSELRHYFWQGQPTARIARWLHVDRSVVRRILKENGLPAHNHLSANRFLSSERTETERRAIIAAARTARRKPSAAANSRQKRPS